MSSTDNLFGLVVCGGKSSRMGTDKGLLTYYEKPQRYHVYDMLKNICISAFISCSCDQATTMNPELPVIYDLECYRNTGPITALLSAFKFFPEKDLLIVGCDYPYIKEADLNYFLSDLKNKISAAAFYNERENLYEPLLGYYSADCFSLLKEMYQKGQYSLQHFLKSVSAEKYIPENNLVLKSIDTPEAFEEVKTYINDQKLSKVKI